MLTFLCGNILRLCVLATSRPNRNILAVQLHPLEDEASDMVTVSHMGIEDGHVGDETVDIGRKEEVVIVEPPPGATIKQNTYFRAQRLDVCVVSFLVFSDVLSFIC